MHMNKERLLNVVKALRESKDPGCFTMCTYHKCGTPGCAIGHYAARRDLQELMQIDIKSHTGGLLFGVWGATDRGFNYQRTLADHFGISVSQEEELFSVDGCGEARTPDEAAEYIERFVAEHS